MSESVALSRIRVVLSHPSHPGNIGAAARAMKTMGLRRLYLVRPKHFPDPEATAMASHAFDTLESAVLCDDLDAALAGTGLKIAMSARARGLSHPGLDARSAAAEAVRHALSGEVAIVFGNEAAGLSNDEVLKCNRLARIPADPASSSLNLAAGVQVMAYECRMAAVQGGMPKVESELATHEEVESFYVHLEHSLQASGFLRPDYPKRLMERLRRMYARVTLEKEEVAILRGMLSAWNKGNGSRK